MLILRAGLYVSLALAIAAGWWSTRAGYSVEVAMLRGLLAFMAASALSYVAELVVMTAPPPARPRAVPRDEADEDAGAADEPVSLSAMRAERDAAADESRAA